MSKDFRNILQNFIFSNIIAFLQISAGIITARILGPNGKGLLVSALFWPQILSWICNFGIGYSNTFLVSKNKKILCEIISISIIFSIIFGIFSIILGNFLIYHFIKDTSVQILSRIGFFVVPILILGDYIIWIFNGLERYTIFNFARFFSPFLYLLLILIFIKKLNFSTAFFLSISSSTITTIFTTLFLIKTAKFKFTFNKNLAKISLKLGLQSHINHFAIIGNKRLDQAILIALVNPSLIAFYSMAVNISEMLLQISNSISLTIIPSISHLDIKSSYTKMIIRLKYTGIFMFISSIFLFLFSKFIIIILYGKEFIHAVKPLNILLPGTIFLGLNEIIESGIRARGKPIYPSLSQTFILFINLILLIVLVPRFDIIGASLASTFSYFLLLIINLLFFFYIFKHK